MSIVQNLTFMVANSLDVYGVETFTVYKRILVLVWCMYSNVGTIHTSDYAWKSSLLVKGVLRFVYFLLVFRPLDVLLLLRHKCQRYIYMLVTP